MMAMCWALVDAKSKVSAPPMLPRERKKNVAEAWMFLSARLDMVQREIVPALADGAFVVADRNYLSARWPGDAYLFAERFDELLSSTGRRAPAETLPG